MEYSILGKTNIKISKIGYGGWQAGKDGWPYRTTKKIINSILFAFNNGINFFDTAPSYGDGKSEILLGKVLNQKREKLIIATKVGLQKNDSGKPFINLKYDSILNQCDNSLKRLDTDYIDLYQIHWPSHQTSFKETFKALNRLKNEKIIQNIGLCNFSYKQIKTALNHTDHIASIQPFYNMFNRGIEKEIQPFCEKHNISILPYSPLCQGLLSGKYTKRIKIKKNSPRKKNRHFIDYKLFDRNLNRIKKLQLISAQLNVPLSTLVIKWTSIQKGITSLIIGSTSKKHIKSNIDSLDLNLPPQLYNNIQEILNEEELKQGISFLK